jgi:signal transduction histidine kinase
LAIEKARLYEQAQQAAALEERQRLARELHDAVTQTLFSTSLIAEVVPELWETKPDLARQRLDDLRRLTRGALAEMRTLLVELRPGALMELPLSDLLRQLGEATAGRTNLKVDLKVETQRPVTLPPDVQVALYRIAQESINNIVRHAQAGAADIELRYGTLGDVYLRISDDGSGFDPLSIPGGHLGVGIMRERAQAIGANIDVTSSPGNGTTIEVAWTRTKEGLSND